MKNRHDFLTSKEEATGLSTIPSGNLSFPQLINNDPRRWITSMPEKKQKTLILADWTMWGWSHKKTDDVSRLITQLIKEGFILYLWQWDRILPLTQDSLELLYDELITKKVTLVHPNEIKKQAAIQYKIPSQQLYMITGHELGTLLENLPMDRPIVLEDLWLEKFPNEIKEIYFKNAFPNVTIKVKRINFLRDEKHLEETIESHKKKYKKLTGHSCKVIIEVSALFQEATLLSDILLAQSKNKKSIMMDSDSTEIEVPLNSFQGLTTISLFYHEELFVLSLSGLISLYSVCPHLEKIVLSSIKFSKEMDMKEIACLNSVVEFYFNQCYFPFTVFKKLIEDNPQLRKLTFLSSRFLSDVGLKELTKNALPVLRELIFDEDMDYKEENYLDLFITAAPQLKILCTNSAINNISFPLSHLESLEFQEKNIAPGFFNMLTRKAPKLKSLFLLSLENFVIDDIYLNLDDKSKISSLETLGLRSWKYITIKAVEKLLTISRLKKLYLLDDKLSDLKKEKFYDLFNHIIEFKMEKKPKKNKEKQIQLTNPSHQLDSHHSFKPKTEFKFEESMTNRKNQATINKMLSRYLELEKIYLDLIPMIQDGTCAALTKMFLDHYKNWDNIINPVVEWDGSREELQKKKPILKKMFDLIIRYIKTCHHQRMYDEYFVGDGINQFLKMYRVSHIISNPWHSIAIVPTPTQWMVYDPNFVDGFMTLSENELVQVIKKQIGNLLYVSLVPGIPVPKIPIIQPYYNDFLEEGGLLTFCKVKNAAEIKPLGPVTPQSLKGLLLRSTSGEPAWAIAIKNSNLSISLLTLKFLTHSFTIMQDALKEILKSLENVSPLEQKAIALKLRQLKEIFHRQEDAILDPLIYSLENTPRSDYFVKRLQTWKKNIIYSGPLMDPIQRLSTIVNSENKTLVEVGSFSAAKGLQLALQNYCNGKMPVFCVDSKEDLMCSGRWIHRDEKNIGIIKKGPGGAIYDFLKEHEKEDHILLINCNIENVTRFYNALLDEQPKADGYPLPKKTKIIGIININDPESYQEADFYSRFNKDKINLCMLPEKSLCEPDLPFVTERMDETPFIMDLHDGLNWESRFLGLWELKGNDLIFKNGLLQKAIDQNNYFWNMRNAPWTNSRFQHVFQQIYYMGQMHYADRLIKLSRKPILMKSTGYEVKKIFSKIHIHMGIQIEDIPVLNPSLFSQFFSQYDIDNETKSVTKKPGLIEKCSKEALGEFSEKILKVNVTRPLQKAQWAMLQEECNAHNVTIEAYMRTKNPKQQARKYVKHTAFIKSNDPDLTIERIQSKKKREWLVFDISECDQNLLEKVSAEWDDTRWNYCFGTEAGALKKGLAERKNIILTGIFSKNLVDHLNPILLQRLSSKESPSGMIALIAKTNPFPYMKSRKENVSLKKRQRFLEEKIDRHDLTFSQLKACENFKKISMNDPWIGLETLSAEPMDIKKIDYTESKKISDAFDQDRIDSVNQVLSISPYVFLSGLTGVGKSTFVQKIFLKILKEEKYSGRLYQGESEIQKWIEDKSDGRKILFIDEANLSKSQWTQFSGLFQSPPGVLINGTYYPLTEEHKVIFAGNPVSYGDERTLSPFFKSHGMSVEFKRLPPEYIYENMLKPILDCTPVAGYRSKVKNIFLKLYTFINKCSDTQILISPREIEMLGLWFHAMAKKDMQENDYLQLAKYLTHALGKNLVPAHFRASFDEQFPRTTNPFIKESDHKKILPIPGKETKLVITASRQPIIDLLSHHLQLHVLRKDSKEVKNNERLHYGGLGGIILEGNSAAGKSDLVLAYLESQGYFPPERSFSPEKMYYYLPVSMDQTEKERLLLKAFDEGSIVVIDEINSASMNERLLNALTMGKTLSGERPMKSGFMIIGTQNPVSMTGRKAPSNALARRLLTVSVTDYTKEELTEILLHRGIVRLHAEYLVSIYQEQLETARREHLSPEPTLRELLLLADESKPVKSIHPLQPVLMQHNMKKRKLEEEKPVSVSLYPMSFTNSWSASSSSSSSINDSMQKRQHVLQRRPL
jgi:hypothetical protein